MLTYVDFDTIGHVTITRCMKCNDTVATLKNGKLMPWSHYKACPMRLSDNTIASLPICKDCFQGIGPKDFDMLGKKLRYGWVRQQVLAYKGKSEAKAAIMDAVRMARNKRIIGRA